MAAESRVIDPNETIGALVQRYPATLGVFNAHGLDVCCGGGHSIAFAAAYHGVDLTALLAALERAAESAS